MTFNYELAQEVIDRIDRDTAPFFAGRKSEIDRFEATLKVCHLNEQAAFLIYQGAPGCGKTSLLRHLRESYANNEEVLFIPLEKSYLQDELLLEDWIAQSINAKGRSGHRLLAAAAESAGELFRLKHASKLILQEMRRKVSQNIKIVLYLDEAQTLAEEHQPGLLKLHAGGIVFDTVCLLAGLGHTSATIGNLSGISRLARNATVTMGSMSRDDCAAATLMLLTELAVTGNPIELDKAAYRAADISVGWPQHLKGTHDALCAELIRTSGVLREVSFDRVKMESDQHRVQYYKGRLDNAILSVEPVLTQTILVEVEKNPPSNLGQLDKLCGTVMEKEKVADTPRLAKVSPDDFSNALVKKGAVSMDHDGVFRVPIPSMVQWAAEQIENSRARGL